MLSSPVELVRVQRHGSAAFRCAVAEMQGWRTGHEDAHQMDCDAKSGRFWVLDGHGGDGAAHFGAPALLEEFRGNNGLASDQRIEEGFESVDTNLMQHFKEFPEKDSGTTVVGMLASCEGGSYSLKLLNCGDSRGLIFRAPDEKKEEESAKAAPIVRIPEHLQQLEMDPDAQKGDLMSCQWPLIAESVDHKPNHPTEKARIKAAGGSVSEEEPPRLDGNLAVSRGLGDFEYKGSVDHTAAEQKVSAIPDIYEVTGLPKGTLGVLACDGVWDVMTGEFVANFVRHWLQTGHPPEDSGCSERTEPTTDLGEIAAELVSLSLKRNSRDNVTLMIVQFTDGSDWTSMRDEMKNWEYMTPEIDEDVRKQSNIFLKRAGFPSEVSICSSCGKWLAPVPGESSPDSQLQPQR